MTVNKVTKLYPDSGVTISEPLIQDHLDALNSEGWRLITLDNMGGWYRFFWAKEV